MNWTGSYHQGGRSLFNSWVRVRRARQIFLEKLARIFIVPILERLEKLVNRSS
jgi:hypothetical protein